MKFPLNKIPGWLVKIAKAILKAHEAGLLEQANQPAYGDRTTDTPQTPEFLRGSAFGGPKAPEPSQKWTREKLGEGFLVAAGCLLVAAGIACATLQQAADKLDCRVTGCSKGYECQRTSRPEARDQYTCVATPPTPSPSPSASPSIEPTAPPTAVPTPTPSPTASPTAPPTAPPTPVPTPTPCVPVRMTERVCADAEGNFVKPYVKDPQTGQWSCWNVKDWVGYMKNHYWHAADGTLRVVNGVELGVNLGGAAGNRNDECTRTDDGWGVDCADPSHRIAWRVDPPRMIERETVVPCPSPSPSPGPSASPSTPAGCPWSDSLAFVGGMMLAPRDCGKKCRDDGYLGYIVNFTATPKSDASLGHCPHRPEQRWCEQLYACQDPRGASIYISLPGHFTFDTCDERSDNPWNCHHKPKRDEVGVTEFRACPRDAPPNDPRCRAFQVDVRPEGPRQLP